MISFLLNNEEQYNELKENLSKREIDLENTNTNLKTELEQVRSDMNHYKDELDSIVNEMNYKNDQLHQYEVCINDCA